MAARASSRLARHVTGLGIAVPQVVSHRVTRMMLAGPCWSRRDRNEFERMGTEKAYAFFEAWNAMAAQLLRAQLQLALLPLTWMSSMPTSASARRLLSAHARRTFTSTLSSGLAPVHRRAAANARRLRKLK